MKPRVLLVSKRVCPLCDEAKEALHAVSVEIPFELETRFVDDDEELRAKHALEVPVVFIDGKKHFFGKVSPLLLRRALRAAERRGGLSGRTKVLIVAAAVVTVLLAVSVTAIVGDRSRKRAETRGKLHALRYTCRRFVLQSSSLGNDRREGPPLWLVWTTREERSSVSVSIVPADSVSETATTHIERDPWDRPFVVRSPGPVHRHGFDAYSVGPNGIDEHGGGDDILAGEDFAPVRRGD